MSGLCGCGCGGRPPIASRNENRRGWVKGEPIPFIHGHNRRKSGVAYVVVPASGCWIWQRNLNDKGYGMAYDGTKLCVAHRWYWEKEYGTVPDGRELDHLCRNRACVNPAHLEPVSHTENVHRGRSTKLNAAEVHEIRDLCARGRPLREIADAFGVTKSNISSIKNRKTWATV